LVGGHATRIPGFRKREGENETPNEGGTSEKAWQGNGGVVDDSGNALEGAEKNASNQGGAKKRMEKRKNSWGRRAPRVVSEKLG